jgi:hypothetical protein
MSGKYFIIPSQHIGKSWFYEQWMDGVKKNQMKPTIEGLKSQLDEIAQDLTSSYDRARQQIAELEKGIKELESKHSTACEPGHFDGEPCNLPIDDLSGVPAAGLRFEYTGQMKQKFFRGEWTVTPSRTIMGFRSKSIETQSLPLLCAVKLPVLVYVNMAQAEIDTLQELWKPEPPKESEWKAWMARLPLCPSPSPFFCTVCGTVTMKRCITIAVRNSKDYPSFVRAYMKMHDMIYSLRAKETRDGFEPLSQEQIIEQIKSLSAKLMPEGK